MEPAAGDFFKENSLQIRYFLRHFCDLSYIFIFSGACGGLLGYLVGGIEEKTISLKVAGSRAEQKVKYRPPKIAILINAVRRGGNSVNQCNKAKNNVGQLWDGLS